MQIFLICILIKQQKHVAINNYLITHFTKQTLNLNYLLLTLNVTVQLLNYPKQFRSVSLAAVRANSFQQFPVAIARALPIRNKDHAMRSRHNDVAVPDKDLTTSLICNKKPEGGNKKPLY